MTVRKRQTVLQILGVIFLIFLGNSLRGCEFYCYVLLNILGCNNPEPKEILQVNMERTSGNTVHSQAMGRISSLSR